MVTAIPHWPRLSVAIAVILYAGIVYAWILWAVLFHQEKGQGKLDLALNDVARPQLLQEQQLQQQHRTQQHIAADADGADGAGVGADAHGAVALSVPQQQHPITRPHPTVLVGIVGGTGQWPFWQAIKDRRLTPKQPWREKECTWNGQPLNCTYTVDASQYAAADALYYHVPSHMGKIMQKLHPQQLQVAISLESSAYYSWLDDPNYMCQYDVEASYRTCSQVQQTFHHEMHSMHQELNTVGWEQSLVHLPALPFEQKEHAVAYLNSNCATRSPRQQIMQEWVALGATGMAQVPVHSFGKCNNNKQLPENEKKMHLFQRYKFCIAMENSIAHDYITEKVWEALAAGCVPVYLGAPTIYSIVPDPQSIIVFGSGGNATSVAELDRLLHRLGSDPAAYNSLLAWKQKPLRELSPGYQQYHAINAAGSNECRLCQLVMQHREQPQVVYKTCLENATWAAQAHKPVANCRRGALATTGGSSSSSSSSVSTTHQHWHTLLASSEGVMSSIDSEASIAGHSRRQLTLRVSKVADAGGSWRRRLLQLQRRRLNLFN